MNKKGTQLSLTVIIVAAILLITMIVVIAIFVSQSNDHSEKMKNCVSQGGVCAPPCDPCDVKIPDASCSSGKNCYVNSKVLNPGLP